MSKTSERLKGYQTQMSIYAEQHKMILASDVLDMIEQLQDDLKDDAEKVVAQLEEEKDYSYADMDEYASRYELNLADCDDWFYKGLARAIDIVKAGGVE